MFSQKTSILLFVSFLLAGIVIGYYFNNFISNKDVTAGTEKFNQVLNYAEKYYYHDVNTTDLVDEAIIGMLQSLDPHSVYIPPAEQMGIEEEFRGNFDGIGIEFQINNDTITVVTPVNGGPSELVGIEPGDRIIKINGKNAVGFKNADVLKNLRGDKGTKVNLTVLRPSIKKEFKFSVVRDKIPIYSVEASLLASDSIGYISLSKFSETSTIEVKQALDKLAKLGMKKLIFDLRNNPGGYLNQAFQIADFFIDENKMIVYTRGRKSELDDDLRAEKKYNYEKIPIVVLINHGSASASEIVAGAIQDWDRGVIIGETSFGKGLVQRPFVLNDSSAVRITISKYYTPSGRAIQRDYKNKEDYYSDLLVLDEKEGENVNHNAETDSTKPVYYTSGGRQVIGGGGITPDFIIKNQELSEFTINLRSNNVFYKYARSFIDANDKYLRETFKDDFQLFKNRFEFSESDIKSFIKFAKLNNVVYSESDFIKDETFIKVRLKAHIARNYWDNNGWYAVLLDFDNQYLKAKEIMEQNFRLPIIKGK